MKQLSDTLANLEKTMKMRRTQKTAPKKTAEIVHLPVWPESARGVPNSVLRGALFAAIQGKDRRYLKRELLAVQSGIGLWTKIHISILNQILKEFSNII